MRFGLQTPIVIRLPGAHNEWEVGAGPAELTRIARLADDLGYYHLTCSEHTGVPRDVAEVRGGTYWDPLATLSYLAGQTRSIKLVTNVLVLAYHHPLALAKSYGTLDRLSGGRVILGVGVGTLQPEFDLLGAPFDDRGPRADDAMRALRAAWGIQQPEYHGTHYDFDDFVIDPTGVQSHVKLWVGGRTGRSLRRAVNLGDGWMPFGLTAEQTTRMLATVDKDPFDVVLQPSILDPLGDPDRTRRQVGRALDSGATIVNVKFAAHSLEHTLEQMAALVEQYPDAFPDRAADETSSPAPPTPACTIVSRPSR